MSMTNVSFKGTNLELADAGNSLGPTVGADNIAAVNYGSTPASPTGPSLKV